jgi:uncharacterized membrane protein HdeD (DUF308 family)
LLPSRDLLLAVLSTIFGGHGVRQLFAAYRTVDRTAWTEKAIQGAVGVIASVLLTNFAMRLFS